MSQSQVAYPGQRSWPLASVSIIITPPTPLDAEPPRRESQVAQVPDADAAGRSDEEVNEPARPKVDATEKEVYQPAHADADASEKEVYQPGTTVSLVDTTEKEVYQPATQVYVEEKEVYDPQAAATQAAIDASEKEVYHFETEAHRVDTDKEVYYGSTHVADTQQVPDPRKEPGPYSPESIQPPPAYATNPSTPAQGPIQPQPGNAIQHTTSAPATQSQTQCQTKGRFKKLHQAVVDKHKKAWGTFTDQSNAIITEQLARIEKTQTGVTNSIVTGATTRYARLEKGTNTRYTRFEQSVNNQMARTEQGFNNQLARAERSVNSVARIKDSIPGLGKQKPQASGEAEKPK